MSWDEILEILSGIPRFPAAEGAQTAILKAMRREFPDSSKAGRIAVLALERFPEWPGLPAVLTLRNDVAEARLALPAAPLVPEPEPTPTERAEWAAMDVRVHQLAKRQRVGRAQPVQERAPVSEARGLRMRPLTPDEREAQNARLLAMAQPPDKGKTL